MKKIYLLLIMIAVVSIAFSSCKKKAQNYCATCREARSGYTAADYCGTESDVDTYINELYRQGANAGQSWSCSKN